MSLEHKKENETEQTGETEQTQEEALMRAVPVKPYFSYILIASLVAVFVAQVTTDANQTAALGVMRSALIAGFSKAAFISGEYWRVLTGAALHGGLIHLAFNCYALLILGRLIETLSNRAHLSVVFLLSVIGGGLMSFAFNPEGISIGASGGVIGFLGYLTIYGFYRRKLLSNAFLKGMLFNVVFIGVIGLIVFPLLGRTESENVPRVDNLAHLGGLLTGAIYGIFQIPRDLYADPRETTPVMETIGFAALGIFLFVAVLTVLLLLQIVRFH